MLSGKQQQRLERVQYVLQPSIPKEIYLEINNTCNHKCFFCSNEKMVRDKSFIDEQLAFSIIEQAFDLGATDIAFYATGEPFLHPKLADFVAFAKKTGYQYIFLTSNGSLADQKKAKQVIDAGLDSIKFSVNAGTRESYKNVHGRDEFDKVVQNMQWWHNYKSTNNLNLKIFCSMVPTPTNQGEYDALMQKIGKYLDDDVHHRECSNQGGNMIENNQIVDINPDNILGTLRKSQIGGRKICPDPFNRIVVSSEGYLTACVVDYQNALIIADLKEVSLNDAWNSEKFFKLRERHLENRQKGLICYNCLYNKNEAFEPLTPEFFRPFLKNKDMEKYK